MAGLAAPGRQVCDIEPRPPWTTSTQTYVYKRCEPRIFSRDEKGEEYATLSRLRTCEFVHANSRLQNVYICTRIRVCVCPAGEFASKYEGAVPGGCVHECAWCLFNAVYLTLAAARWKVVLIFNEVTRPGITSQLLYSGRYMYIGTSEESERIE